MFRRASKREEVPKIDFDELIKEYKVFEIEKFSNYLVNIYKDLAIRSDEPSKGINKITFSQVNN